MLNLILRDSGLLECICDKRYYFVKVLLIDLVEFSFAEGHI